MDTYKGVRDFYPEDERIQQYIFTTLSEVSESFGYERYHASILEPTELFLEKTSEEIIQEQTYTFIDRGGRSVTLRPEMTPTVARMVVKKRRELGFPLRWYSIPNCFRYERPQRGRMREFWQWNVDLFGVEDASADAEIIELAYAALKKFGTHDDMFTIKVADRNLLETAFDASNMDDTQKRAYRQLLDKKSKMTDDAFSAEAKRITENDPIALIESTSDAVNEAKCAVVDLVTTLHARGVTNVVFDPSIVRGFDYYTGMVFEVFDTSGKNTRSLFGGGRYDYLVEEYGGAHTPAVGVAAGDVVLRDFLETHNLLPESRACADLYLAPVDAAHQEAAAGVAAFLRSKGVKVALGMKHTKITDHIKAAHKLDIPYFIAYGSLEKEQGLCTIKNLNTKEEIRSTLHDIPRHLTFV
jgi:histidyl-tRNA synthetase